MALGWLWWRAWTGLVAGDVAALCVAGVALGDICFHFAWQAWHVATSALILRGRHGTYGTGLALVARLGWISRRWRRGTLRGSTYGILGWLWWRAWTGLVAGDAAALCVAGVALGNICHCFAWQAWHLATSTFVWRGRRQLFTHNLFYFSIIHHILCLSFLPRPPYNICRSLLEEVDLWGYPVL